MVWCPALNPSLWVIPLHGNHVIPQAQPQAAAVIFLMHLQSQQGHQLEMH